MLQILGCFCYIIGMITRPKPLPNKASELKSMVIDLDSMVTNLDAVIVDMDAELHAKDLMIQKLKHQISGQNRHRFGIRSEALNQLELVLESEEIADAVIMDTEAEVITTVKAKPSRKPLPEHLPRDEQIILPALEVEGACNECGGKLKYLGEDITEILEYVPSRFRVKQLKRQKLSCSCCETIHQAAMPSRPIERGIAGPALLAHVLVSKYADHLPLYRQSQIYAREKVDLSRSTLAEWVGKSAALLEPLAEAVGRHVKAGQAIFVDDTPVKVQSPSKVQAPKAKKTKTGRFWAYVRDERPWDGCLNPAVYYQYTPDRKGKWTAQYLNDFEGWMHADGYAGFNETYHKNKIVEVACMAHIRRKFFDIHKAQSSPIAEQALKTIAKLYKIEQEVRGHPPDERQKIRHDKAKPIFNALEKWLPQQLKTISGKSPLASVIRYAIKRMKHLKPYLKHGVLELDNNTAERSIRPIAIGRKNYLFMGSDRGGKSAAIAYTFIGTAKLCNIDTQEWLADVLGRIAEHKINQIDDLLPWNYQKNTTGIEKASV